MTAEEKIKKILDVLKEGKTIYISTQIRSYKIKQKDVDKFDKAGNPLFKTSGDCMLMASGSKYVCIDYCSFTVEG